MEKKFIYIAAPYSSDPNRCTQSALRLAEELKAKGHIPFVPHLCHFWDMTHPHNYKHWFEYVSAWISRCDGIVRFPGHSPGADEEVRIAEDAGVPLLNLEEILTDKESYDAD